MSQRFDIADYDALSVIRICVPVRPVHPEDGPVRLLSGFSQHSLLPVVDKYGHLIGIARDVDFLNHPGSAPRLFAGEEEITLKLSELATIGEARTLFHLHNESFIPIVDEQDRYTGFCASRQELSRVLRGMMRPVRIGGLATPLGVYMSSGKHMAGAGWKGLVATGALFAVLALGIQWLFELLLVSVFDNFPQLDRFVDPPLLIATQMALMVLALMALIRLTPLAGLHAAEHMTINAIENGLEVTEANVRRQPREHLRCGTNVMVLMIGIQLGWLILDAVRPYLSTTAAFLYLLFWIMFITFSWKRLGIRLQTWFTTKPPTRRQLENGMAAGQELLAKYHADPHPEPGFLSRVMGSGILQVLGSFLLFSWLLSELINRLFPLPGY